MPRLTSWLVGGFLALVPLRAAQAEETHTYPECNREPTESETAAAKGAFQAGQASFNEADYQRAITYWEDAYRRDCTAHALLLNLARAYELYGQKRQAVLALESYLLRKPDVPQRGQIERRIEALNAQIAQEQAATPVPSPIPQPPQATPTTEQPATEPGDVGGKRSILPLVVAGAGGAIAIVGGVLYLGAKSDQSDIEKKCPNHSCADNNTALAEEGDSANRRVNVAGAITIGGLAIAAGGVVWYFVSKPSPSAAGQRSSSARHAAWRPALSPAVGRNFTGLSLGGSF